MHSLALRGISLPGPFRRSDTRACGRNLPARVDAIQHASSAGEADIPAVVMNGWNDRGLGMHHALEAKSSVSQRPALCRRLGLRLLVLYGVGITGAGIYVLVGAVAGHAGAYSPWAFLLAGRCHGVHGGILHRTIDAFSSKRRRGRLCESRVRLPFPVHVGWPIHDRHRSHVCLNRDRCGFVCLTPIDCICVGSIGGASQRLQS
jgi:hypothetical protein